MAASNTLSARTVRSVYLVTYSQASEAKFATREFFGEAIKNCFENGSSKVKVEHWVCSREAHYHAAFKFSCNKRWLGVKTLMKSKYDVIVNFKDVHANYYEAYKYVIEEDKDFFLSAGHPNLSSAWTPPKRSLRQISDH